MYMGVSFSPDGSKLYVSRGAGLRVLDAGSGADLAAVRWAPNYGTPQFISPLGDEGTRVVLDAAEAAGCRVLHM